MWVLNCGRLELNSLWSSPRLCLMDTRSIFSSYKQCSRTSVSQCPYLSRNICEWEEINTYESTSHPFNNNNNNKTISPTCLWHIYLKWCQNRTDSSSLKLTSVTMLFSLDFYCIGWMRGTNRNTRYNSLLRHLRATPLGFILRSKLKTWGSYKMYTRFPCQCCCWSLSLSSLSWRLLHQQPLHFSPWMALLYSKRFDILTVCNFHFIPKQASECQASGRASKNTGLLTLP